MGLLDRLFGPPALAIRNGSWPISQTPGVLFNQRTSSAGVNVSEDDALSLSAVFAGVNLLARIVASFPLPVYRTSSGRRDVVDSHPAHKILNTQFNPEMTAVVGRRTEEFHRLLWGNSYTEIVWDGAGRPVWLWPIEPWRVRPEREGEDKRGELYFLVDGKRKVAQADMLHRTLTSTDGVCGRSFVDYAFTSLGLSIAAQEFAARFFGNSGRPGVLLVHDGSPDKKQRAEMREEWDRAHAGGPDNAHKTGTLWGGWKVSPDGQMFTPADQQLLESRQFSSEEVARWLNIPPHLLRDLSRATFANIEHQGIDFVTYSIGPTLVELEQEYDRKLLDPPRLYCKHNVNALMRGDSASRASFYTQMISNGTYTINQARELEDHNPIGPDGDVHFVPVNLQTLDRAINMPERTYTDPSAVPPAKPPAPPTPPKPPVGDVVPPEPPKPAEPTPKMRAALHGLIADTFGRMLRKETNEGRRAAKKPGEFLAWMDRFYADYQPTLALALAPVLSAVNASVGTSHEAAAVAAAHCKRGKDTLLDLAGDVTASKLADAAEAEFVAWESNRAADEADRIIGSAS